MLVLFNSEKGGAMGNPQAVRYEKVVELCPDPRGEGQIYLYATLDNGKKVHLCSEGSMDRIVEMMIKIEESYKKGYSFIDLRGVINSQG